MTGRRGSGRRHQRRARVIVGLAVAMVVPQVPLGPAGGAAVLATTPQPTTLQVVAPCRLADTAEPPGDGYEAVADGTIEVQVAGRCGLPTEGVSAASLVLTIAGATGPVYLTAWPADQQRPLASNVNALDGQTRANGAVVQLSADGAVRIFRSGPATVRVDLTGGFLPEPEPALAQDGRFVPIAPHRAMDSRSGGGLPLAAGSSHTVPLPATIPADAVALAVNLTSVGATVPGRAVAHDAAIAAPGTTNLEFDQVDRTRAASSIVGISPAGLAVHVTAQVHLIVDITGYFTGASAPAGGDGLFVPVTPQRLLDTRGDSPLGHSVPLYPGGAVDVPVPVPGSGAVLNLTVTVAAGSGWVTTAPGRTVRPATSSVNTARVRDTAAAMWIGGLTTAGVTSASSVTTHHVIDLFGWFTGSPAAPTASAAANVPDARGCLPGTGTLDRTRRWYKQNNTSASTSAVGWYPAHGRLGALAVVGDSLTWQTIDNTMNRLIDAGFGPICVDGAVFRATTVFVSRVNSAVDAIGRLKRQPFWATPTVRWVVAVGTNDVGAASTTVAQRARIDTVMATLGPTWRSVLWVNVRTRRAAYQATESRWNANVAATPHTTVVDWSGLVAPQPSLYITGADLVHLTPTGIVERPRLLANSAVAAS